MPDPLRFRISLTLAYLALAACGGVSDPATPDAEPSPSDACTGETDAELCERLAACESITAPDRCGDSRTVDCGRCAGSMACVDSECRTPVCADLAFPASAIDTDLSSAGEQDAVAGITADGTTVLYQRRSSCGVPFQLLLADPAGVNDLTGLTALQAMQITAEGTLAITADGRTIIGVDLAGTSFLRSTRSAVGALDFATAVAGELAGLSVTAPQFVSFPAISGDGLALYYRVDGDADPAVNGIYEATRVSTTGAFAAGTRMPGAAQDYQYVTATSSDRMTLFLQTGSFGMVALSRTSRSQPFVNPDAPGEAPTVPGFRTRPLADCSALVGTCTLSGCPGEEVCVYSR